MKDKTIIGIAIGIAIGWLLFHNKGGAYAGVTNVPTDASNGSESVTSSSSASLPFLQCPCGGTQ